MDIAYIRIGDDDNSKKVWIANPTTFNGNSFLTKTICDNDSPDFYRAIKPQADTGYIYYTIILRDQKAVTFVKCPQSEADYVILPYYNGKDFKKITEYVSENTFVVEEKVFIETYLEIEKGIKLPNGRDNEILGVIYKEHRPTETPKFEGDMNTLIEVYNPKAEYIKFAQEIILS